MLFNKIGNRYREIVDKIDNRRKERKRLKLVPWHKDIRKTTKHRRYRLIAGYVTRGAEV